MVDKGQMSANRQYRRISEVTIRQIRIPRKNELFTPCARFRRFAGELYDADCMMTQNYTL